MVFIFSGGYCDGLHFISSILAKLDVLTSFAVVAASAPIPYVRPKMLPFGAGVMNLKQARHPCVEMQDSVSYIPNDVHFQQGYYKNLHYRVSWSCSFHLFTIDSFFPPQILHLCT